MDFDLESHLVSTRYNASKTVDDLVESSELILFLALIVFTMCLSVFYNLLFL